MKPTRRPVNPCFSSGPCAKRPGWTPAALSGALVGRSHRSSVGLAQCVEVIERSRKLLQIPADYKVGIVPASDTGAIEMAMWSLLGARGVDILSWENFGETWVDDVTNHLKISDLRHFGASYGKLPDLAKVDTDRDVVFVWNGTTSGVRVPNGDWIANNRQGLTICDATSAAFAMRLPWPKLDVVTWSWQKALGGEAGHGMIALSPRAVERLQSYTPPWPLPKIFRMTAKGKLIDGIFRGETINTPSMLCIEDALELAEMGRERRWARRLRRSRGGQPRGRCRLGWADELGRVLGRGPGDPLMYVALHHDFSAVVYSAGAGNAFHDLPADAGAPRQGGRWLRPCHPPRFAAGHPHLDGGNGRAFRRRGVDAMARLGLGRGERGREGSLEFMTGE